MSDADRLKWDAKHRERGAPGEPSRLVVELDDLLPRRGHALDVAGGAGRHSIWLAKRGLDVTLVDVSPEALRMARDAARGLAVTVVERDLDTDALPEGPFGIVLCFHFVDRRIYRGFAERLAPDGLVVVVHPTRLNLERHPSPGPAHLVEPGELRTLVPGVEVIRYDEGWLDEGRHEARLVGRRPDP